MSDLQCAATFVVVDSAAGAAAVRALRPAAVYATSGADRAATELARLLDVARRELPAEAASPEELVSALDGIADEYRGECVAVVVATTELTALARRVLPDDEAGAVVVEIDADGHRWMPLSGARGR